MTANRPNQIPVGTFVFWDRSTHTEEVWKVIPTPEPRNNKYYICFVVGPPLRNPRWTTKIALPDSLTEIPPLELLALMAKTPAEWSEECDDKAR